MILTAIAVAAVSVGVSRWTLLVGKQSRDSGDSESQPRFHRIRGYRVAEAFNPQLTPWATSFHRYRG